MEELKICRFCLAPEDAEKPELKHLFTEKIGSIQVWSLSVTGIELCEGTEVTDYICTVCLKLMETFYKFKQICKKADSALKMYFMTKTLPKAFPLPLDELTGLAVEKKNTVESYSQTSFQEKKVSKGIQVCTLPAGDKKARKVDKETAIEPTPAKPPPPETVTTTSKPSVQKANRQPKIDVEQKIQKTVKEGQTTSPKEAVPGRSLKRKATETVSNVKLKTEKSISLPIESFVEEIPVEEYPIEFASKRVRKNSLEPKILNNTIKPPPTLNEQAIQNIIIDGKDHGAFIEMNDINSSFSCDFCPRSFPLRQQLDLHLQTHDREKNVVCSICERRFLNKHNLAKHMMCHMEKLFVCKFCSKSFSRSNILKTHQEREHAKLLTYCDECEKGFAEAEDLNNHKQEVHLRVRRFQCKHCDKQFAYKQGLERHEVVHAVNQEHTCEHCGEGFNTANKLSRHLLSTHAGDRRYPCKYCPKTFLMSHHRSRHVKGHLNGTLRSSKKNNEGISYTLQEVELDDSQMEENVYMVTEVEALDQEYEDQEYEENDEMSETYIEENVEIEEICIKEESPSVVTALSKLPGCVTIKKNRKQ